jgi:hypothetical protein
MPKADAKPKKEKAPKDKNAPKRPLAAYMFFSKVRRAARFALRWRFGSARRGRGRAFCVWAVRRGRPAALAAAAPPRARIGSGRLAAGSLRRSCGPATRLRAGISNGLACRPPWRVSRSAEACAVAFAAQDMRPVVSTENPGISFGEVGKQLGARWAEADEKTKKARARAARTHAPATPRDGATARPGPARGSARAARHPAAAWACSPGSGTRVG